MTGPLDDRTEIKMTEKRQRLWTFPFISITLAAFFTSTGCTVMTNGTPLYIDSIGGSAALSGILTTGFGIACALSRVIGGN